MEAGGERGRSWYLSKEEIERGSPSRRDGVGAAKEAQLRATYCSFIRDVGLRLKLPQITIATGIVLCHRFYLHQSHARNEWQTVATVCIFLASKIENTHCSIERVVIVAHETMYKRNPDAARRINQKELLEKRKDLILTGEALLLSTIRFDFNIHHPYEPLKLALKNLGISQKEVKQAAINLINDTLRTTLVVQFKPHYIAAGSLSLAAKFHDVKLPSEKGKVWWHQFDVAPMQLEAAIQQMKELFMKRNPHPSGPAIRPIPAPAPVEKQQIISFPKPAPVEKQQIINLPKPAPVEKQQILSLPKPPPVEKQQIVSFPKPAPVEKQQIVSFPKPDPVEKQQIVSFPKPAPVEKQQIVSFLKPALKYTYSRGGLGRPAPALVPTPTPVEKQQIISTTGPVSHAYSSRGGLNGTTTAPTVTPTPTLVKRHQTAAPTVTPNPVKKQQTISTPDSVLRHAQPSVGGVRPTRAPARARTPVKKQQIISAQDSVPRHTRPSVGGERRSTPAPAPALVRKQQIISTPDSVLRHTHPSRRGLTSNNLDRHASRCTRVDSPVHRNSTGSPARNEDSKPLRMQVDHSLSRTAKDGRSEKPSFQAALNADHGHHVSSGAKDVNMTRVTNLVGKKRRISEAGEPPAPADRCAGDARRRPQIKSVIVAPPSWKKQKIDV